jgi:hypothetical protein
MGFHTNIHIMVGMSFDCAGTAAFGCWPYAHSVYNVAYSVARV